MDARLDEIVPDDPSKPYDIKEVIRLIVDNGEFFEIHEHYAPNIVVGFSRLGGYTVGIVANQPVVLAGRSGQRSLAQGSAICPLL